MRKISSGLTFWIKRVFPIVWFGVLAIVAVIEILASSAGRSPLPLITLAVPALMALLGYVLMRAVVFDLADEVLDAGDALVVRRNRDQIRIPLADIINVDSTPFVNPPRVVLTLRTASRQLGRKIAFSPQRPFSLNPFATNPMIDDLIDRIDRARRISRV